MNNGWVNGSNMLLCDEQKRFKKSEFLMSWFQRQLIEKLLSPSVHHQSTHQSTLFLPFISLSFIFFEFLNSTHLPLRGLLRPFGHISTVNSWRSSICTWVCTFPTSESSSVIRRRIQSCSCICLKPDSTLNLSSTLLRSRISSYKHQVPALAPAPTVQSSRDKWDKNPKQGRKPVF